MVTHMDGPCDTCGDIGVFDAIITCCDCKISRQHVYCMKTMPPDIPLFWRCEECEHRNETHMPKIGLSEDLPKAPTPNCSGIVHEHTKSGGVRKLSSHLGRSHLREKWVDKGKTKYIPCQEAIKLSSGSKKLEPTLKSTVGSRPQQSKVIRPTCERLPIRPKAIPSKQAKANPAVEGLGKSKPCRPGVVQINESIHQSAVHSSTELKDSKAVEHPRNRSVHGRQPLDGVKCLEEVISTSAKMDMDKALSLSVRCPPLPLHITSGANASNNVELGGSNAHKLHHKIIVSEVEKYSQSIPSLHAYWKGNFKLPISLGNLVLNDTFKAHPPSRVHLKVYEVLKKMPGVLDFELIPRFKVWADTFADYCPDKDDIGLYFFPGNCNSSVRYTSLLEFIWTEKLVMRSYVDGVELLVLTSRVLKLSSQKWNGDYFLWGVFRRPKTDNAACDDNDKLQLIVHSTNAHDCHAEGKECVVEDMDIDLIGENYHSRIEMDVPKNSFGMDCGSSKTETAAAGILVGNVEKACATSRNRDSIAAQHIRAVKCEPCNDIPPGFEGLFPNIPPGFEGLFPKSLVSAVSLGDDHKHLQHFPVKAKTEIL